MASGPGHPRRPERRWPALVSLLLALVAAILALGLPTPDSRRTPSTPTGPARLGDLWPAARISDLPGLLTDGSAYQPMLVVDATTSAGVATSPDGGTTRFVVQSGNAAPVALANLSSDNAPVIAAITHSGNEIYWAQVDTDRGTTIWRCRLHDSSPERIASDAGDPIYSHSQHDLELDHGQLFWVSRGASRDTEVHSVSTDGGRVRTDVLNGSYALTTRPWVVKANGSNLGSQARGRGADVDLLNLDTRVHLTAKARPDQLLNCSPTWCRITTEQGTSVTYADEHPDGTALRRIGNSALVPINPDVALLDRFEILGSPSSTVSGGFAQQLWLHDLTTDRAALIADNATDAVDSRDGFLWWTTTNDPNSTWHILDLHRLT